MTPPPPSWQNPDRRAAGRVRAWLENERARRDVALRIPDPVRASFRRAGLPDPVDPMTTTVAVIRKAFIIGPGAGCCWMHRYLVGLDEQTGEPLATGPVVDVHPLDLDDHELEAGQLASRGIA